MVDKLTKEFAKDDRPKLIIDTSSILANPEEIFKIRDSDIIIPMTVLEELDGKKKIHSELGFTARYFIRKLEDIRKINNIKLSDTIPIDNNSTITIAINGLSQNLLGKFGLSLDKHDNRIIGVALGFSEKYKNVDLSLYKRDISSFQILKYNFAPDNLVKVNAKLESVYFL